MTKIRLSLGKFILMAYRAAGITVLYGGLLLILGYTIVIGFYAVNSSWVAPFIVTPTSDKILDMTAKLVTSQQTLNTLVIDRDRLDGSLGDMRRMKSQLDGLDADFRKAISLQSTGNQTDAPDLTALNERKRQDNTQTEAIIAETSEVEAKINKDLAANLITKGDAAVAKTQLRQSQNQFTDGQIAEVLLRDNVRQKEPKYTTTVDTLAKEAELKSEIAQLAVTISSGEEQLVTDKTQIGELNSAVATAQDSPYFLATKGDIKFAFVPYDNENAVKMDAPVYGCFLNMVICHRVGTVKHIFKDEEKITHPIFKTDVRGFVIQLELTDQAAAKDKVLFVGRKPLLF
jgi:hypothetical protein